MSKKNKCKPLWMLVYVEKFLADTAHLTAAQCGALINLLCAMWRSDDGTLPDDAEMLTRISKVHPPHWNRTWKAIKSLFDIDGDRVTSTALQAELGKANAIIVTRRATGSLGGQTTQFKKSMTRGLRHTKTAPKPLINNDGPQANGAPNYNYNMKEKEERSGEPRPETGSPSLEEGLQRKRLPENHTISEDERNTNLAKLNDLRCKLNGGAMSRSEL